MITLFSSLFLATAQMPDIQSMLAGRSRGVTDYSDVAACIGPMGVAKMQALDIKTTQTGNRIQTMCISGQKQQAESYAKREISTLLNDPTVFELEGCNQAKADAYRKRVEKITFENQTLCHR